MANMLNFRHEDNTVIAVLQDYITNEVLMVGNMNREALVKTLTTGYVHFWSLSRKKIWLKGETSKNFQIVEEIRIDCDADAILIKVKPLGPTCHTGNRSCFYRSHYDIVNSKS
ncbi:phosphoribosyl-AMP cyclohydrolase [Saccharolobus caldissimus]|nr:phosphoribosyl-AMP cyclohydrolase [Saccharolobus caldissimus]